MKGWTANGTEVTLSAWQENMVNQLLEAERTGQPVHVTRARAAGWSVVRATVNRLLRAQTIASEGLGRPASPK